MFNSSNYDEYVLTYYYATAISIMASESHPRETSHMYTSIIVLILGATLLGVVIGQFSNLLEVLTFRARMKNEEVDILNTSMFQLKISEGLQQRVVDYYELVSRSKYQYKEEAFETLNHSLRELIGCFQVDCTLKNIKFIDEYNFELIQNLSEKMSIESFQTDDIIIKQHTIGRKFYFIIEGLAEVLLEHEDYEFFNLKESKKYFNTNRIAKGKKREDSYKVAHDRSSEKLDTGEKLLVNNYVGEDLKKMDKMVDQRFDSLYTRGRSKTIKIPKKYSIINELKKGDYFGEISLLTKYLTATATVKSIGTTILGVLK